jgi:hypothetical protein
MDYSDAVSLSLSTAVLVNFPKPRFAVLPVSLGVELAAIGGTVSYWRMTQCLAEAEILVERTNT